VVRLVNEEMDAAASSYREQLNTILAEITDVDRRLDRLYDAIETGKLALDDLSPRIKQLKTRREQLEAKQWELEWQLKSRKVELSDMTTITNYVNELRDLLNGSSIAERKSFIKSFVKEIVVTGGQVKIEYTIPIGDKGFSQESLAVPHIVRFGGADGIRTHYLLNANQALSQLSYSPVRYA
jgi:site-specific DNA recombinase